MDKLAPQSLLVAFPSKRFRDPDVPLMICVPFAAKGLGYLNFHLKGIAIRCGYDRYS
jgi:hypothetical protein